MWFDGTIITGYKWCLHSQFFDSLLLSNVFEKSLKIGRKNIWKSLNFFGLGDYEPCIIMCNNKATYNSYSKMTKRTYTAQQSGEFGGPGQTLTWGLSQFHVLTLRLGGPPENFWNQRSQKWSNPAFWKSSWQLYLCGIFHCNSLFRPPLTRVPGQIAPLWAALTAPAVTTIYDSLVS
jgi:hypothetical protein